jgi:CheY-like chemotaxis protein
MKYLFVDDTPEHLKPLMRSLRDAGHNVVVARNLGVAWHWLERGDRFDLALIDLALDRRSREFEDEFHEVRTALALRNLDDLPVSGQALGMRLWRRRRQLMQRYCYITNNVPLWLPNMVNGDAEFDGKPIEDLAELVMDKSSLWPHNVEAALKRAYEVWDQEQWLI